MIIAINYNLFSDYNILHAWQIVHTTKINPELILIVGGNNSHMYWFMSPIATLRSMLSKIPVK